MQLVAQVGAVNVVANSCPVNQTEGLTTLLANTNATDLGGTITLLKLERIGKGLNRRLKLLGTDQVDVFDVIGILSVCFGT